MTDEEIKSAVEDGGVQLEKCLLTIVNEQAELFKNISRSLDVMNKAYSLLENKYNTLARGYLSQRDNIEGLVRRVEKAEQSRFNVEALSLNRASQLFNVDRKTLKAWIDAGKLKSHEGKVLASELYEYLKEIK